MNARYYLIVLSLVGTGCAYTPRPEPDPVIGDLALVQSVYVEPPINRSSLKFDKSFIARLEDIERIRLVALGFDIAESADLADANLHSFIEDRKADMTWSTDGFCWDGICRTSRFISRTGSRVTYVGHLMLWGGLIAAIDMTATAIDQTEKVLASIPAISWIGELRSHDGFLLFVNASGVALVEHAQGMAEPPPPSDKEFDKALIRVLNPLRTNSVIVPHK